MSADSRRHANELPPPVASTPIAASSSPRPSPSATAIADRSDSDGWLSRVNASLPSPLSPHTIVFLLAGALARGSSATITSPLDAIKVRVQFSQRGASAGVVPYSGARDAARDMWQREGPRAFYRGLSARLLYIVPAASISFLCYEQFRALYHLPADERATRSRWVIGVPLLFGGVARVCGTALRTPFDVIRQRMQIMGSLPGFHEQQRRVSGGSTHRAHGVYSGSADAFMRVRKVEGLRALWAGLGATIIRDIPFAATYFFAYESSRTLQERWLQEHHERLRLRNLSVPSRTLVAAVSGGSGLPVLEKSESRAAGLSTPRYMLSGAFAAACAVLVTMPFDVVKVRLQTQGSLPPELRYRGILHCASSVARTEGIRGFWKGCGPRLAYLAPASAITFSLYEFYKQQLEAAFDLHR